MAKIGIVGYGGFGAFLRQAWERLENVEVTAVSDTDKSRDPGNCAFFTDWRQMVASGTVDLVSVATPPNTHANIACGAMERGCDVVVEKPIALTLADAERIVSTQRGTGRHATVDFLYRFTTVYSTIRRWCTDGPFGRLTRIAVENYASDETLAPEHWFWDRQRSGGILVEHGIHFIDLCHWCAGSQVDSTTAVVFAREDGREDRVLSTITYENGLVTTHYHAFTRPGLFERTSVRFVFDLAQIEVQGWIPLSGTITALCSDSTRTTLDDLPGLHVLSTAPLREVQDESRPAGWGQVESAASDMVQSGGRKHAVTHLVDASFALARSKAEEYARANQALLLDVISSVRDPLHVPIVTLADGVEALRTALASAVTDPPV